jgi:glycosyltransferase involved in cell wall biosynthesis
LRLLFLNHNVAWSGTFHRAYQLGRALTERGRHVTVVTTSAKRRLTREHRAYEGVQVIEMPDLFWGRGRTGWDPWNTLHRSFGLRVADFDAIHAFDSRPAVILPALHLAARGDLPLAIDWADWWGRGGAISERPGRIVNGLIGGFETWFEESFRTRATATTVISRALEQRAVSLGVPAESIRRIPNPCEPDRVCPRDRTEARAALGLDPERPIVLHVGLSYPRDLELLMSAMERTVRTRPATQLVMVGNPKTPVPLDRLPTGALRLTGFVDWDVLEQWLAAADCCVIPFADSIANRGRWPGKLNEYLTAGRPVVMTRVGDAAEWVETHGAGWIGSADPAGLAVALECALAAPAEAALAGERARALAEGPLSLPALGAMLDTFYDQWLIPNGSRSLHLP